MGRGWSTALVILLAGGLLLAFGFGFFGPGENRDESALVSSAAATEAEAKLERLQTEGAEARLSATELTSLFRYRPEIWNLGAFLEPEVGMAGDTLRLSGSVVTAELPTGRELDALRRLLPDTARVDLTGTVEQHSGGRVFFQVLAMEVVGMPIPKRYYPILLDRLGQSQEDGLSRGLIAIPLPGTVGSARVESGELILTP